MDPMAKAPTKSRTTKPAKKAPAEVRDAAGELNLAVTNLLDGLDHPLREEIEVVRRDILGLSSTSVPVYEGVKWNSASFRTGEYFATVHLRSTTSVAIVLHAGATAKCKRIEVDDPAGLLTRLAPDRCMLTLGAGPTFRANRAAMRAIVRAWIGRL